MMNQTEFKKEFDRLLNAQRTRYDPGQYNYAYSKLKFCPLSRFKLAVDHYATEAKLMPKPSDLAFYITNIQPQEAHKDLEPLDRPEPKYEVTPISCKFCDNTGKLLARRKGAPISESAYAFKCKCTMGVSLPDDIPQWVTRISDEKFKPEDRKYMAKTGRIFRNAWLKQKGKSSDQWNWVEFTRDLVKR